MPQSPFYSTKTWRDAREKQLRSHPNCFICGLIHLAVRAVEVDHVRAIEKGGHPTDPANLRSLCRKHHSQKTILLDGMHSASGKAIVVTGPDGYPIYREGHTHATNQPKRKA